MRALHQSIRRFDTRGRRRSSVALRPTEPAEASSVPDAVELPHSPSRRSAWSARARHLRQRLSHVASTAENPLSENSSCWQQLKFHFLCPPHGYVARWLTGLVSIVILYGTLIALVGDNALPRSCSSVDFVDNSTSGESDSTNSTEADSSSPPTLCKGGNIFGLFILFVCSMVASSWSKKLNLPPLLGMLIVGCVLGNVPVINVARHISKEYFNTLRELALCVILLRAGLSLDPATLRRLSAAVFRLSFLPCLTESCVGAICAKFFLGFPWEWGFMLGFVLGAVSPAVVVLGMLKLEYRGYGVEKGIPTLIIAASSMDDVLAITGFSLALGVASDESHGSIAAAIFRGPRDALAGIAYGVLLGTLLWYIPHRQHKRPLMFRFAFLVGGGVVALLGCEIVHMQGAGAMATLTLAFVAGYGWRKWDGWAEEKNPLLGPLDTLWWFMQPLLFGLIGGQIEFDKVTPPALVKGLCVVGVSLVFRIACSFMCMMGTNLSFRERLFVPFSWLPKATVQAAIGPVALDMALTRMPHNSQAIDMARQILTIAVLVILLTAPVGAFLIGFLGPRMLERDKNWQLHHYDMSMHNHQHQHQHQHDEEAAFDTLKVNGEHQNVRRRSSL